MEKVNKVLHSAPVKHTLTKTENGCHLFYFGAVGLTAHGVYAYAALALFVLFAANLVLHFNSEA